MDKQQYIANWHNNFEEHKNRLLSLIEFMRHQSQMTDEDLRGLGKIEQILIGKDAQDVERALATGIIKKSTFDKVAKINKDMSDEAIDHLDGNPLWKQFLKKLYHLQIERGKENELNMLEELQISLDEE